MRHLFVLVLSTAFGPDVDGLRAPDFATREAAEARLDRWGWLVWPVLDRRWPDPEQDRRARRVVRRALWGEPDSWACLSERVRCARLREWVWIDPDGECRATCDSRGAPEGSLVVSWVQHDPYTPWGLAASAYLERGRRQREYPWWYTVAEQREATALLARDLEMAGVPRVLVRWWLAP